MLRVAGALVSARRLSIVWNEVSSCSASSADAAAIPRDTINPMRSSR